MLDITEIEPGLWQGADPGTELPSHIHYVVDLRDDERPILYHKYVHGILWMPVRDGIFPGLSWLESIVDYILQAKQQGFEVLVHCAMGISRSALVCAAVLMKEHQITLIEAKERLRERRPWIDPAPRYDEALREYEQRVLKDPACEI